MDNFGLLFAKSLGGGGGSGTDNYNELSNKPQINSITLSGNKTLDNLGIQGKLTFDDAPTENSDNPVKSDGVYTALGNKQDALTFNGTYNASTNPAATVSTVTNAVNDLDVTGDSSVSASKTISAWSETDGKVSITTQDISITKSQVSDFPTLGTASTKDVPTSGNASATQVVMGNDSRLSDSRTPTAHNQASNTINAMTGYTAPVDPSTWQTVSASDTLNAATQKIVNNEELNKTNISKNTDALIELVDGGAKNVLKFDAVSRATHNTVDFTYNADGSITVNGTSPELDAAYTYLNFDGSNVDVKAFCNGSYVISGCPTNSQGVTLRAMGTEYTTTTDSGSGAVINEYTGENVIRVAVYVAKNSAVTNLKIKPMICSKAAWDISQTYQPYRPSYQELYERVLALENA